MIGSGLPHQCSQFTFHDNLKQISLQNQQVGEQIASSIFSTKEAFPHGTIRVAQAKYGRLFPFTWGIFEIKVGKVKLLTLSRGCGTIIIAAQMVINHTKYIS